MNVLPYTYDFFISHAKDDVQKAELLYQLLSAEGAKVFLDVKNIKPGMRWPEAIEHAQECSKVNVVLISSESLRAKTQRDEITRAQNIASNSQGRHLVAPVLLDPTLSIENGYWGLSGVQPLRVENNDFGPIAFQLLGSIYGGVPPISYGEPTITNKPGPSDVLRRLSWVEWAVPQMDSLLLDQLRKLHDLIARNSHSETEVVVTLYGRSPERVPDIGGFAYDLLYYRNIRDDALMFGPVIQNDERTIFCNSNADRHIGKAPTLRTPGGFLDREDIKSFAKFKLFNAKRLIGLLFVNARSVPFDELVFNDPRITELLTHIEKSVNGVASRRFEERNIRLGRLLGPVCSSQLPSATVEGVNQLFTDLNSQGLFEELFGSEISFSFSAYLYLESRNVLKWLWSTGPTSTRATVPLTSQLGLPIEDVATDPRHKPLLIHNVKKSRYAGRVTRTNLGESCHANMVVPVLETSRAGEEPKLVGILDIQVDRPNHFATDDVQLLYALCQIRLSKFFRDLLSECAKNSLALPLHSGTPYTPFQNAPRAIEDVHELLELNFNPMKFLLHWDKIKELLTTGATTTPASVEVWPTMRCTHNCFWCRTAVDRHRSEAAQRDEMGREELLGIAADLKDFPGTDVLVSGGGEPLEHAAIHEFIERIADQDRTIGIFTNGSRPSNFMFWESLFRRNDCHRFVRLSFDGHSPEAYFRTHFFESRYVHGADFPPDFADRYAEVRKMVLDILGMRSSLASVSIGETIVHRDIHLLEKKASHAKGLAVDFLQMRPELSESSNVAEKGHAICSLINGKVATKYTDDRDFAVIGTDSDRSFTKHDERRCYAMHLVPTLAPDWEETDSIRVMPCSYAINNWGQTPNLGKIRQGGKLSQFWAQMNRRFLGNTDEDPRFQIALDGPIDPVDQGCPQCRYYTLNKRLQVIQDLYKSNPGSLRVIDGFVQACREDAGSSRSQECAREVDTLWATNVKHRVDTTLAIRAFDLSKKLGFRPSF